MQLKMRHFQICISLPFTFKSEENISQINDSEPLNIESLKYNLSNNEVILLDKAWDTDFNFYDANFQKSFLAWE